MYPKPSLQIYQVTSNLLDAKLSWSAWYQLKNDKCGRSVVEQRCLLSWTDNKPTQFLIARLDHKFSVTEEKCFPEGQDKPEVMITSFNRFFWNHKKYLDDSTRSANLFMITRFSNNHEGHWTVSIAMELQPILTIRQQKRQFTRMVQTGHLMTLNVSLVGLPLRVRDPAGSDFPKGKVQVAGNSLGLTFSTSLDRSFSPFWPAVFTSRSCWTTEQRRVWKNPFHEEIVKSKFTGWARLYLEGQKVPLYPAQIVGALRMEQTAEALSVCHIQTCRICLLLLRWKTQKSISVRLQKVHGIHKINESHFRTSHWLRLITIEKGIKPE